MKLKMLRPRLAVLSTTLPGINSLTPTPRLQGRAAVERRERYLRLHPLCVECEKEGRVEAAVVVDHIIPLWKNGADDYDTNGQGLCQPHHDIKTAAEARERAGYGEQTPTKGNHHG